MKVYIVVRFTAWEHFNHRVFSRIEDAEYWVRERSIGTYYYEIEEWEVR